MGVTQYPPLTYNMKVIVSYPLMRDFLNVSQHMFSTFLNSCFMSDP